MAEIVRKKDLPTSPAHASRLRVFQPSRRPKHAITDWMESEYWGKCRVVGRLGQGHADMLDAFMFSAVDVDDDGKRLHILVDPYRVRLVMGGGRKAGYEWMMRLLDELMDARIEWECESAGLSGKGHIIDAWTAAKVSVPDRWGGMRELMYISMGEHWSAMVRDDIRVHYDPTPIAALRHGVSQAAARLMLTHKRTKNGVRVDRVLDWLGVPSTGGCRRKARMLLMQDTDGLARCGIRVSSGKLVWAEE